MKWCLIYHDSQKSITLSLFIPFRTEKWNPSELKGRMPQSREKLSAVKRAALSHRLFILLPYPWLQHPPSCFLTPVCKSPVQMYILGVDDVVSCLYMARQKYLTEVCGTAAVRPLVQPNHGCKIPFKRSGAMFLALTFHPSVYLFDFLDCLFKAVSQAKVSPEILK